MLLTARMRNVRALLVLLSLFAFATSATAKPSDWADVIEKPGEKSALPSASENAPKVVTASKASAKASKKERANKKAKKTKKAPRRGKTKHARR